MLLANGEDLLKDFADQAYPRQVTEVIPGVIYHVMGYGHSNASFIIAENSVVLIDTLDSDFRGNRLKALIAEYTSLLRNASGLLMFCFKSDLVSDGL